MALAGSTRPLTAIIKKTGDNAGKELIDGPKRSHNALKDARWISDFKQQEQAAAGLDDSGALIQGNRFEGTFNHPPGISKFGSPDQT